MLVPCSQLDPLNILEPVLVPELVLVLEMVPVPVPEPEPEPEPERQPSLVLWSTSRRPSYSSSSSS